jgi:adenylate cyclase
VAAGGLGSAVPETLRDLIEQDIAALDVEDLTVVEAASVVGRSFSAAAVAAGAGVPVDEVERRCADLARRRRFLRRGGEAEWPDGTIAASFSFVHDLHRQVLDDRLPAGRRVGLHRAIGDRLEAGYADRAAEHAAELAGHHMRGRQAAPAVRYLQLSARQAIARGAPTEAVRDLRAALGLLEGVAGIADAAASELALQVALGGALVASEGYGSPDAESALCRAVELARARDDPSAAVLLHALAGLHEYRGDYRLSEQLAGEAVWAASACGAGPQLLEAHELMACSLLHQGRHRAALEQAEQALSLQEAGFEHRLVALHGEDPVVSSHDWAGLTLWCMGHPDPALERILTALEIASAPGRLHSLASAHVHAARLRQMRAEPQEAAHHAELALALADEHGFAYHRAAARILLGWARAADGAAEEGLALLRDGLDAHRATGAQMDRPYFLGLLAEALGAANRPADGLRAVAEALGMLDGGRTFFYEAELHRLRGGLMLREPQGDPAEALASLRRAVEVARRQDAAALELRAALALARLRPPGEEARSALEVACSRFGGDESSPELAEARSLLFEGA